MNSNKLLIIGWDGATFDIIKPLVDQGRMPNIASLMQRGVWGKLKSTIPPLTPVAWTSMTTGVNPGKHGIYDAMAYRPDIRKVGFVNATLRNAKPIWSILSERNRPSGVMNIPMTYPPDEVKGFVISGMFTPDGVEDFTYPAEIKKEIEEKFGKYEIECSQTSKPSTYLKNIIDMVEYRERVTLHLMESHSWDFFFTVFMESDRVQHFFWKYLDPSHPEHKNYGNAISMVYERLDEALGKFIKKAGPDVNIMMASDHGSGPLETAFFLNNWLLKRGYLSLNNDMGKILKVKKNSSIKKGLVRAVKMIFPKSLIEKIKPAGFNRQEELNLFLSIIDWETTVAFSEGVAGGIYINHDIVSPAETNELAARLKKELLNLKGPSGKPVVDNIYMRDEVYQGDHVKNAPDLIVICSAGYQIIAPNEFLYFNKEYEDTMFLSHRWSGRHEQDGIFLMSGSAAKKGVEIIDANIQDITPTALYLMRESIPAYMDGRVLQSAIDEEVFRTYPVIFTDDAMGESKPGETKMLLEEEERAIAEHLKGLGYIE